MNIQPTFSQSVEWKDNYIQLLNQQALPERTEYLKLTSIEEVYDSIVTLKVTEERDIRVTAAFGLALAALAYPACDLEEWRAQLKADRDYLEKSNPTVNKLSSCLDRMMQSITDAKTINEAKTDLIHEAIKIQIQEENE
ncbi:initiation factor 2B subunit1/2 family protein [Bacillus oleivorans]|uniref:Initiation factor 2B subunit1/2 family protein n=1 Tax=Bacillus oleivorans TaxID=1448271 RepID=A0A285CQS2_9BACI|nr:hypothetical protein [Bacillus oleivorans]SNX69861.1 initiation factor 2B subunit1/2 family protein [Bacillus oleivorans]